MFTFKCIHCQTVSQTISRESVDDAGVYVPMTHTQYIGACYACSHGHTVIDDNGNEKRVKGFMAQWNFGQKQNKTGKKSAA